MARNLDKLADRLIELAAAARELAARSRRLYPTWEAMPVPFPGTDGALGMIAAEDHAAKLANVLRAMRHTLEAAEHPPESHHD